MVCLFADVSFSLFLPIYFEIMHTCVYIYTRNSAYNEVAFNEKSAIMKENLRTKYTPFTYKYIGLNEKLPITKQNLRIFFSL